MTTILRFMNIARPAVVNPARIAGMSALVYVLFCTAYVIFSSQAAVVSSATKEQLSAIEITKGVAFVAVTGLLLFFVSYARWNRIGKQERTIRAQEDLLLRAERKSVAALCTGTIVHDLNNLLLSLSGLLEELESRETGEPILSAIRKELENHIGKMTALSKRVASAAKDVLPEKEETVNLAAALPPLVSLLRKHPDVRFCDIRLPDENPQTVSLNRDLLEEAVLNLVINAAQAAGPRGRIELRLATEGESVVLEVHDSGPGIPEELRQAVFEPCFTTKPEGTGLGLLTVLAFVSSCGGEVSVGRSELGGALFRIRIPLAKPASRQQAPRNP